jgi:hypothetical protein
MNKQTKLIIEIILGVALLLLVSASALGQDQSPAAEAGQISAPLRSSAYPEVIYDRSFVPDWDRGYVIHHEFEVNHSPGTPMVVMYDATGKRVREGRIWPQGAGSVTIRRTAATRDGAILASGGATMQDGSIQHFIVRTDLSGNTAQTLQTGPFLAEQVCEASDGSVWSLGKEVTSDGNRAPDTNVLRQYSFEKGLLQGFLPEDSVSAVVNSNRPWFNPFDSFVRCGKDKVSVYLNFTDEYAEVNTSSFELKRWKVDEVTVQQGKASGLAIAEDGRVYASFSTHGMSGPGPLGLTGLYQLKAQPGMPITLLLPVGGTISIRGMERGQVPPPGTFVRLWGADGNQLVIARTDSWDMYWVNVIHPEGTD